MTAQHPPAPLKGRRIVELSQFIAGPTAAQTLADYGAEVLKIEPPGGDGSRGLPGTEYGPAYFRWFNTGKNGLTLDLRSPEGRERLEAEIAGADAFLSNISPGALRRLGLDGPSLRARYPDLVITLISGFAPDDERTCMDAIAQCETGFAAMNGDDAESPRLAAGWPVDFFCGTEAALATAMALAAGQGCLIEITMLEVAAAFQLGPAVLLAREGGVLPAPTGNRDRASAPAGIFPCRDGQIYVYAGLDSYWSRLAPLIGAELSTASARLARAEEFHALFAAWTAPQSRDAVLALMETHGVPAGILRSPAEGIARIAALRPGAVSTELNSGAHLPARPVTFDGKRIARRPAFGFDGGTDPLL